MLSVIYQEVVDFNVVFKTLLTEPIIINDLIDDSEENKADIEEMMLTKFSSDMQSILPTCKCGDTQGEYAIGSECPNCNTLVNVVIEDAIQPLLWFRRPNDVEGLINPAIMIMLLTRFKKSGFEVIRWLTDTHYKAPVKTPKSLMLLEAQGVQRGYNYFVRNFDYLMSLLFSMKDFSTKSPSEDLLEDLLKRDRHKIFSDYVPLPNKALLIIERSSMGTYADLSIASAIDAMSMVTAIDNPLINHNLKTKENRTAKALYKLSTYYQSTMKKTLVSKTGIFRKHVFGSRTHFSFRSVASSITEPHNYDEIYAPWGVGVSAFRIHLINKLLRLGWTYNDAVALILSHIDNYHPLLNRLLAELISEAPDGKIAAIIQRNPSMLSGSAQAVWITKFKTNPNDQSVSLSILIVKAPNCDFDGDELNISLAVDNKLCRLWQKLAPHNNVFVLNQPGVVSKNVAIPNPVVSTMANWMSDPGIRTSDARVLQAFDLLPECPGNDVN